MKIQASAIALLIGNLIPLLGVIFYDWGLFNILFLYWLESAIIGIYTIFKFIVMAGWFSVVLVWFFCIHFGTFMMAHLVILISLFLHQSGELSINLADMAMYAKPILISILALFFTHGLSFVKNFINRQEYLKETIRETMTSPYKRIMVMHITIVLGGWLISLLGSPVWALVILVVAKTWIDLKSHIKQHQPTTFT